MKTKAAVLHEIGRPRPYAESRPLLIEELDLDPPGEGEVLVRIGAAGLCHSDLSVMNGDRPRPVPMALGHEAAGEVVEVGRGVSDLKAGDHVVMIFVPSCGHCLPAVLTTAPTPVSTAQPKSASCSSGRSLSILMSEGLAQTAYSAKAETPMWWLTSFP